jgi:hypothetical protein
MNDDNHLGGFEQRLLAALRTHVQQQPDMIVATERRRAGWRRLAIAGATVAAAVIIGVPVLLGGSSASPAFAVEPHGDGTLTVTVNRLDDAAGLERKLKANGIDAQVDYTPTGKTCKLPRFTPARLSPSEVWRFPVPREDGHTTFKLRPAAYNGHILVIVMGGPLHHTTSSSGQAPRSVLMGVADGPVAPCKLIDAADQPDPSPMFGVYSN